MDMENIADRLLRRFGPGTRPDLRKQLYSRLAEVVEREGEPAYVIIASAAADAEGKTNPGRYFAHVVMRRLQERGVIATPEI